MTTTQIPRVLWAQRSNEDDASKNVLYLTVEMLDYTDTKIDLKPTYLKVEANSPDKTIHYDLNIDFFDEVDPEHSHVNTENGSHIFMVIRKKTIKEEYWPRLTKEKLKYHFIHTDFDKWVDEDEQNEAAKVDDELGNMMNMGGGGAGGLDFSQLMAGAGGAGGLGGAGGQNFDISSLASQLGQASEGAHEGEDNEDDGEEEVENAKADQ
ncbi:SBA1 [[Candida] subhashii]|uniref:SBA1 n=1 Tax=[Candida] subhashii TaxID=561895 RepID=A0A8J5UX26_9ASCO|nr:SBA1 [[Candida] subhashii]KAG7662134.1 SBA1 [[Candida] subhashii]